MNSSDMAVIAAKRAIEDSGIDAETLDQIILAHNFGNVVKHTIQTDVLPALASRVKQGLGIKNPNCVAYDILFWLPRAGCRVLYKPIHILKVVQLKKHW
jgi:3-oxoacyl-[acyl-carrier-protein] synthase-3